MAGGAEYTTLTRYIDVDVFISLIKSDIQKLIREYGHKNCGLRHEELCKELKKFINQKKSPILSLMKKDGKEEWNSKWSRKRNEFFNRLFEEEGFINMCYPKKYTDDPKLYQLKSKHIQFCKKRDERKATVEKKNEFDECVKYNQWIMSETTSLTREFLNNVSVSSLPTVKKYFITKAHPKGYDPRDTYRKSKLDCTKHEPPSRGHPQIRVKTTPTKSLAPTPPDFDQKSQGKGGRSIPDGDGETEKEKSDVKIHPPTKPPAPDTHIPSLTNTKVDSTANDHDTPVKTKALGSPDNRDDEKKKSTRTDHQPPMVMPPDAQPKAPTTKDAISTPVIQRISSLTATTSSSSTLSTVKDTASSQITSTSPSLTITSDSSPNLGSPLLSNTLRPAADTKGQDRASQSGTTSDTLETTHTNQSVPSTTPADSSLHKLQAPALTAPLAVTTAKEPGTPSSSSASAITITVTTTTTSLVAVTNPTISTTQGPIPYTEQAPSASSSQEAPPPQVASRPKATESTTESQPIVTQKPTPLSGDHTGGVLVTSQPVTDNGSKKASLSSEITSKPKDMRHEPGVQLQNIIIQTSEQKPDNAVVATDVNLPKTIYQTDTMHNISRDQIVISKYPDQLNSQVNSNQGKILNVKPGKYPKNNPLTPKGKNDNPRIIPEEIPSLTHIIPTFLVILATITLLFQLYKYTPFGFLFGRKRKRKKRDLRSTFVIPEESTYEYPNITVHKWEDPNLVGKAVENDVFIKLLKINKYKQEMQKRKTKNKKTLIEVHMEVLEEYKSDEWELHKGDFLEICLRGFINEENDNYSKLPNTELTAKSTKNDKIIENIQKHEILWNNWIENHRNILEQWKKEEWFQILKNKWRNEEQMYKEKNNKLQENILNEQDTYSIVSQKEIWKQWISKQATLIDLFNKEDWFKSLVYAQDKEKDNYHINEYNDISVTSKIGLKNEKVNHEHGRSKNIIKKLMVQIHMMVLEECIKEDIIKHNELCIDNFIEDIHNQNNYDEIRNIPKCYTDDFSVPEYEEIHTSRNK